jgi:hypothetical protein
MSKRFLGIAKSLTEHVLVARGAMRPARVWSIDPVTGKRELIEDNRSQVMECRKEHVDTYKKKRR